jgi:hypothetical protein
MMRAVIEGNPGLGIGPGWIDESVENIVSIPFENYVAFPSGKPLPELKALFIVAAKDGGGREFLITEEIPRLISWACIAHQPSWSTNLHSLVKKANSWIAEMAKDTLYWKEYGDLMLGKFRTHLSKLSCEQASLRLHRQHGCNFFTQ